MLNKLNYINAEIPSLREEFNQLVKDSVSVMLSNSNIKEKLESRMVKATMDLIIMKKDLPLENIDITLPKEEYGKLLLNVEDKSMRSKLWKLRTLSIRKIMLVNLLDEEINKKKVKFRINKVFEEILKSELELQKANVTIGQIVHRISSVLHINKLKVNNNLYIDSNPWIIDEMALQLIQELAELDYLDLTHSDKTHMVRISEDYLLKLNQDDVKYGQKLAHFLSLKTLTVDIPSTPKNMISQSNWWYKTPELSDDLSKFINIMKSIKFKFKDNAIEDMEELYIKHLNTSKDKLEDWDYSRIEEFRNQVKASNENGGHYIGGKFDSVLRYYFNAEIGHFQTSSALRSIVEVDGIKDPIKMDMRNNVVQMYAVSLGLKDLGKYVGLVKESEQDEDLRLKIANTLNTKLNTEIFNKDNIKPLFMVWAYNAGKDRILDGVYTTMTNIWTGMEEIDQIKVDGLVSLCMKSNCNITRDELFKIWEEVVIELVPSIVFIKAVFKQLIKFNPLNEVQWTLPDGGIAQYASVETNAKPLEWCTSDGKTRTHTHHRKDISTNAKSAGLLPRTIHSLDAYLMRQLVIRAYDLGITVIPNHDSFLFDRCHQDTIENLIKELLVEILEENPLKDIVSDLNKSDKNITVLDSKGNQLSVFSFGQRLTKEDILNGNPVSPEEI